MIRVSRSLLVFLAIGVPIIGMAAQTWPTFNARMATPVFCVDQTGTFTSCGGSGGGTSPASGTGGVSSAAVGTTSAQVSAAATRTARLAVQNVSATATVACSLGGTAALNTGGSFMIAPGMLVTFSDAAYAPSDALNCIASAAATPVTVWSK